MHPIIKFTGTHLFNWVERGIARVKSLAQDYCATQRPWSGLEPGVLDPEPSELIIKLLLLHSQTYLEIAP